MKRLNPHVIYTFGRNVSPLERVTVDSKIIEQVYPVWLARQTLLDWSEPDTPLLGSARRAVKTLIAALDTLVPRDVTEAFGTDPEQKVSWVQANAISKSFKDLESVLGNEMPDIALYAVTQKGIYRTDDLIERADHHLTALVRLSLSEQTKKDLIDAGRCLAYELPTACAFHLWRSVESVMQGYFQQLNGSSFEEAKVSKNWGAYIKALQDAGAPTTITVFLDNIRSSYRNPQTHPDMSISVEDAQRLFAVALGVIDQMETNRHSLWLKVSSAALLPLRVEPEEAAYVVK